MRDLIGRERAVIGVVTAVVAAALVYSTDRLMVDGILTWEMGQREYLAMAGETAGLYGLFALVFRFSPSLAVRGAGSRGFAGSFCGFTGLLPLWWLVGFTDFICGLWGDGS